ncbi:hypothetical protein BH11PLA2_BH11PLA2_13270 [soil metagenome]
MSATGNLLVIAMLFATSVHAAEDDAPGIYQGEHFYNAIGGNDLTLEANATPTDVSLGEAITYTITVRHVKNPSKVLRPDFYKLREFGLSFGIYPQDISTTIDGDTVAFTWKMRPRTVDEIAIPGFRFDYFNPGAAEGNQVRTLIADPIPITVRPKEKTTVPSAAGSDRIDESAQYRVLPGRNRWLAIPLVLVPLTILSILWWRRRNPDGVTLAAIKQDRVVRSALAKLKAARDADAVAVALQDYVRHRPINDTITDTLRACDAQRFGFDDDGPLAAKAIAAIEENEQAMLTSRARTKRETVFPLTSCAARQIVLLTLSLLVLISAYVWNITSGIEEVPDGYVNAARVPWDQYLLLLFKLGLIMGINTAFGVYLQLTSRPRFATPLAILAGLAFLACVVVDGSVKRQIVMEANTHYVTLLEPARLHNGNGESYDAVLAEPLPVGTELTVRQSRHGWLQVELANGVTGWVLESQTLSNASAMHR